jgi:RNA polymerase sigma-70 factor (ECF subfamily)
MDVYIERALHMNERTKPSKQAEQTEDTESRVDFFEAIYRQYYKNVYNYICFRINNHFDAEDLAGSVFEKAMRGLRTYKPGTAPVEAWLIGIAKNVVADYFRSKNKKRFTSLDDILELISTHKQPEEIAVINDEHRKLIRAMNGLKEKERQILSMKFATDLKNNEIADILNISCSNVGVLVHRAVKKLKKALNEEGNV